jgi:hypothetical protein
MSGTSMSPLVDSVRYDNHGDEVNITFGTGNDHSKWAVAEDETKPWICIADLNRKV